MRAQFTSLLILLTGGLSLVGLSPAPAQEKERCSGHDFLPQPRSETSCASAKPKIYASPDKALHALVLPVGVELNATPDIESRVVVRTVEGKTLTSRDFSSPRGANGYYVERARWSPDSQFFVFSMSSSGGHSPWSFPTWVFSRDKGVIASFNAMIGDNPTVSADFKFSGPHTLTATTWEKSGSDKHVPVVVDLEDAIKKVDAGK
jgi:hypothetical protein